MNTVNSQFLNIEVNQDGKKFVLYPQHIVSLMVQEIQRNPIMENYHGDLYHDIKWIEEQLEDQKDKLPNIKSFYWGLKDCGTSIGYDLKMVEKFSKIVFSIYVSEGYVYIAKMVV